MQVRTQARGASARGPLVVPRIVAPKMDVVPVDPSAKIPPHPIDGVLKPEGGKWTRDQFTFRMLIDGVIKRPDDAPAAEPAAAPEAPAAIAITSTEHPVDVAEHDVDAEHDA
jgi:hypothetical protein